MGINKMKKFLIIYIIYVLLTGGGVMVFNAFKMYTLKKEINYLQSLPTKVDTLRILTLDSILITRAED